MGPAKILESYTRACTDPIHEEVESFDEIVPPLLQDYISQPLSKIWEERKAKPPTDDALVWKSILDFVHGENDICMPRPRVGQRVIILTFLVQVISVAPLAALTCGMKPVSVNIPSRRYVNFTATAQTGTF